MNPSLMADGLSQPGWRKQDSSTLPIWKILLLFLLTSCWNVLLPAGISAAVTSDTVSSPKPLSEAQAVSSGKVVIGNKDTRRYHLPGMPNYDNVKEYQRVYFNSEREAIDNGYNKAGTDPNEVKGALPDKEVARKPDQPQVVIPVAQKNERVLENRKPANKRVDEKAAPKEPEGQAASAGAAIVGNTDTKRYHLPGMPYYNKVKAYHRVYFQSEQEAIDKAYYKAGTGKDVQKRVLSDQKAVRKPEQPEVVVPVAQKNEKPLETPARIASEPVGESPKPQAAATDEKTAGQSETPQAAVAPAAVSPGLAVPKGEKSAQPVPPEQAAQTRTPVTGVAEEKPAGKETAAAVSPGVEPRIAGLENFGAAQAGETPVKIEADNLSYDNERDVYAGEGNVVITYGDGVLTASRVEYDRKKHLATAQGGAFLKMAEDSLAGDKIVVNVEDKTGVAYNSKAFYARNHFYIKGDKIEKTGEASYRIEQPLATTCDGDNPDWQLAGSEMKVTIDGYGWVTNARLLTKGLPVVYTPIVAFPAKTTRQTGFLFPYVAYSRNKDGLDIEIPFFWAINPQLDATFYSRYMEKRGFKEGIEFRYFLGGKSFGTLYGDYMDDNKHVTETIGDTLSRDWEGMHRRWSYMINHQTNFDSQFYIRTDLRQVSDSWYFRDFNAHNYYLKNFDITEQDPFRKISFQGNESLRFLESTARVFKGWNNVNVMARISTTDDFAISNNDRTLQKYPEIIVTGIKQPLFSTPAYIEFTGVYDYFYREEGSKGHYLDVAPSVSLPLSISNYLKITPQLTVREIYWNRENGDYDDLRRSDVRTVVNPGVTVSSRLYRVFDAAIFNWDKLRHEIKPELAYSYIPRIRQDQVPEWDAVNAKWILRSTVPDYIPRLNSLLDPFTSLNAGTANALMEQNAVAWSLTNTITARSKDKTGSNSYTDIFRFKLFQVYDINEAKRDIAPRMDLTVPEDKRRSVSDLGMELDLKPHQYVSFSARNKYSIYEGWREQNYDLKLNDWRGDELVLGYRDTLDFARALNLDLKAILTERLSGRLAVRLDLYNHQSVENTIGLTYKEQCWAVGVDYTRTHDDERVIFRISLTGLGMPGF